MMSGFKKAASGLAGNGKAKVNVTSWHKTTEVAQLSNFAQAEFIFELSKADLDRISFFESCPGNAGPPLLRINCGSVEGFLQALKVRDADQQRKIALTHGKDAKNAGKNAVSEIQGGRRICFLQGFEFEYASPIHRALIELSIWEKFRTDRESRLALSWTGEAQITHNMGRFDPKPGKTSLPKQVFVRILEECRKMVNQNEKGKTFQDIYKMAVDDSLNENLFYQSLQ
jgi:hypothetical protein